jgi:hypothetical protein
LGEFGLAFIYAPTTNADRLERLILIMALASSNWLERWVTTSNTAEKNQTAKLTPRTGYLTRCLQSSFTLTAFSAVLRN